MSRYRATTRRQTFSKPDVTPLVDLTFLLLIVFMITAPALEYSLDIAPPELNAEQIEEVEHKVINLDHAGSIYLNDIRYTLPELKQELIAINGVNRSVQIYIRADKSRLYGEVIEIMKMVKSAGISDVSLVTQAENE